MADKPIKLTDAQLTTLQQVADPNYKKHGFVSRLWEHNSVWHYFLPTLKVLHKHCLVEIRYRVFNGRVIEGNPETVHLTPAGRAHLDSIGIAPVELAPPPKTDKERIAELEAALEQIRQIAGSPVVLDFQGLQTELNRIFTIAVEAV